jgi:hypothetical protein
MSDPGDKTTTVWRGAGGTQELVARLPGLPDPIPKIGFRVHLEEHGDGVCFGYEYDGPGRDAAIVEVKLLVSASLAAARKWRI